MTRVKIKLFGSFRQYGDGQELELDLPDIISLDDLRRAFIKRLSEIDASFNQENLVSLSAFANEQRILNAEEKIKAEGSFAILPPVSGG